MKIMKKPKRGDLVYDSAIGKFGIVMTWSRIGGKEPSVWEIMYEDNEIDSALECEISVVDKNWQEARRELTEENDVAVK